MHSQRSAVGVYVACDKGKEQWDSEAWRRGATVSASAGMINDMFHLTF